MNVSKHAEMADFLGDLNEKTLGAYGLRRSLLKEHYGIEQSVLAGGYGYRQILELIQNGADAILEANEDGYGTGGRIEVILGGDHLYVANTGAPLSRDGIDALLTSHNSPKRGNQIGRFGLGFKSLLRLGGVIDVFSSTWGGIRFDPTKCQKEIAERFDVEEAPALRLAWRLGSEARSSDSFLSRLDWAETVVRIKIEDPKLVPPLKAEILDFPAEFLLFTRVPISLSLDVGETEARKLSVLGSGATRTLVESEKLSEWRLFDRLVSVKDQEARSDATHIHARDEVPLTWAVPVAGRRDEAGRFWAFFPTKTSSYISGILNAPWKLNNDRQGLISGAWNEMLMKEAAALVVESLPSLSEPDDPARHLDSFPRRPDRGDVPAMPLLEGIWDGLESAGVIPDCNGDLRNPVDPTGHPTDKQQLLDLWMALADEETRAEFIHPSCLRRDRKARLQVLSDRLREKHADSFACCGNSDWHEWVTMVRSGDETVARDVLVLAKEIRRDCTADVWKETRPKLEIILDHKGVLRVPHDVLIGPEGDLPPGSHAVAESLIEDSETLKILRDVMGVAELGNAVWEDRLEMALEEATDWRSGDAEWRNFWRLLLAAPRPMGLEFARENRHRIKVADRAGNWMEPRDLLIPGRLVAADDQQNADVLVHSDLHGDTYHYLHAVGVNDLPEGSDAIRGDWGYDQNLRLGLSNWLDDARIRYRSSHQNSARSSYLFPKDVLLPNGWHFLKRLGGAAAAKLTCRFLEEIGRSDFSETVAFGHCTQDYPTIRVEHPFFWWILQWGEFEIEGRFVTLRAVVEESGNGWYGHIGEMEVFERAFGKLRPVLEDEMVSLEERQDFWEAAIEVFVTPKNLQSSWTSAIWNGAASVNVYPTEFNSDRGTVLLTDVYVASSAKVAERVRGDQQFVFVLDPSAIELWVEYGAKQVADGIEPHWTSASTGVALIEAIPELAPLLTDKFRKDGEAIRVAGLAMRFNTALTPIPCLLRSTTFYFDADSLACLSLRERYTSMLDELANGGALRCSAAEALAELVDTKVAQRRAAVAREKTLEAKLMLAVGGQTSALLAVLGELGRQSFVAQCAPKDLACIVLRHLGPTTLSALRETLLAEGLAPPARWGTSEARDFVKELSFPESFAAAQSAKREPEEWSQGPFPLPPLHDFQVEVRDGIQALIENEKINRRGVISLPTGGGKTRVTVESAVELVMKPESTRRGVLWIAQTDELCEQAVQAFRQVWPNKGAERTGLRILRLWGGNPTPTVPGEGEPFVVVASIQTFDARGGLSGGPWDKRLGMLVIDECHHAITPSYTRLFKWLGFDARSGDDEPNPELVILGLSATPFRMDDEESKRLASRFAKRWFPHDQEALHRRLLNQKVLCRVNSVELPSGTGLSSAEEQELDALGGFDGFEAERLLERINQRLGDHGGRNRLLVDCIKNSSEGSILFFANSVSQSDEMAARLNLAGIPAAAVSGSTSRTARRYFLEQFQNGELRVLCNHSVLTTGFDAPRTDMLLIARQVFSPVRYMQMVGRGLRGVKNGGTEQCRIVTVLDNLGRFQNRHPYHYCRQYFENYHA